MQNPFGCSKWKALKVISARWFAASAEIVVKTWLLGRKICKFALFKKSNFVGKVFQTTAVSPQRARKSPSVSNDVLAEWAVEFVVKSCC